MFLEGSSWLAGIHLLLINALDCFSLSICAGYKEVLLCEGFRLRYSLENVARLKEGMEVDVFVVLVHVDVSNGIKLFHQLAQDCTNR